MTQMDGIWPTAGHAQRTNLSRQAVVYNGRGSHPGGDGTRAAAVIRKYQTRGQPESPAAAAASTAASPAASPAAADGLGAAAEAAGLGEW